MLLVAAHFIVSWSEPAAHHGVCAETAGSAAGALVLPGPAEQVHADELQMEELFMRGSAAERGNKHLGCCNECHRLKNGNLTLVRAFLAFFLCVFLKTLLSSNVVFSAGRRNDVFAINRFLLSVLNKAPGLNMMPAMGVSLLTRLQRIERSGRVPAPTLLYFLT